MASFVAQTQGVHRSRFGSSRLGADGVLGCPCATTRFFHNKGYLGHWPLARRQEKARCKTNMVWAYPTYKENEMKRIGALHGMGWLVLSLIFQTTYIAAVVAQEINEAPSPIQLTSPPNASFDYRKGRIEQDTTWRDTVYVGGDVTIASGATLTLVPDEQVHFLPYHDVRLLIQPTQEEAVDSLKVEADNVISGAVLDSSADSRGNMSTSLRVVLKLIAGTLGGVMGSTIGGSYCDPSQVSNCFGAALFGYWAGTATGVTAIDLNTSNPRDRSLKSLGVSLGGSAVGLIGCVGLTRVVSEMLWPSILIGPVVGATWASELWRNSSETRRLSIGLMPNPKRSLSVVASIRF